MGASRRADLPIWRAPARRFVSISSVALLTWASLWPAILIGEGLTPAASEWRPTPFNLCSAPSCEFSLSGVDDRLVLSSGGVLSRLRGREQVFMRALAEKSERVLFSGLTGARNQLVVAIARERMSISAVSAIRGGLPDPRSVDRAYRLEVVHPKSGDLIKWFDLGSFLPVSLSSTEHGELVLLAGRDLQTREEGVRVFNTRSGRVEQTIKALRSEDVQLGADGLIVDGKAFSFSGSSTAAATKRLSRDPYSIAEYEIHCSPLPLTLWEQDRDVAVVGFDGVPESQDDMLSGALSTRLSTAGVRLVERRKIRAILEELSLQASGLTAIDHAAEIGELGNASNLIFGSVGVQGSMTTISARSVQVEAGSVENSCEVACRDCRQDDLLEAINYLAEAWVSARPK